MDGLAFDDRPRSGLPSFRFLSQLGVEELDQQTLLHLLELKCHAVADAVTTLVQHRKSGKMFIGFQEHLYAQAAVRPVGAGVIRRLCARRLFPRLKQKKPFDTFAEGLQ